MTSVRQCITECIEMLQNNCSFDIVVSRLECMIRVLREHDHHPLQITAVDNLDSAIQVLSNEISHPIKSESANKIHLPIENVEHRLSLQFKLVDIAKIYGVSRHTVFRRLKECGMSVSKL